MPISSWSERLPGGKLIERGIQDFQAMRHTAAGCLIHVARGRLTRAGLLEKSAIAELPDAELELYRLLRLEGGDAYSRYNSLIRELVSFENALDRVKDRHSWKSLLATDRLDPVRAMEESGSGLTKEQILAALRALSDKLGRQDLIGEVCLFGGTVMMLAFTARLSTKDVDALFQPAQIIREFARQIATEQHLSPDWLNDGVKGFVSDRHETTVGNLPQLPHLRLTMPVPEYLLAMKCMAARISGVSDEPSDVADIVFLIRHLKLNSAKGVLDLVGQYYPANRIPVKTQYLVEGLFEEGKV